MINLNFTITNPFSNKWSSVYTKAYLPFKHKAIETNVYNTHSIISIDFSVSVRSDHAGIRFAVGLLGYEAELHFYDTRHWDYENNCWETYP